MIDYDKYNENLNANIQKYTDYYNRNARESKPVKKGDKVMFQKTPTGCWYPGQIMENCREPKSFLIKDNNDIIYRTNQQHIKLTKENNLNENSECESTKADQSNSDLLKEVEIPNTNNDNKYESNVKDSTNFGFQENSQKNRYVTKRGRTVKQPEKLNL